MLLGVVTAVIEGVELDDEGSIVVTAATAAKGEEPVRGLPAAQSRL
jgi:hypothetical protein